MLSAANVLTFLRAPAALLFFIDSTPVRIFAIVFAMLSDAVDGYIARRNKLTTQLGAILDPIMDKFFVFLLLGILLFEQKIDPWEVLSMISRDFFLCIFGLYLYFSKRWSSHRIFAACWGKVTTALQFIVLIGLTLGFSFPPYVFFLFILFGLLAFIELINSQRNINASKVAKEG